MQVGSVTESITVTASSPSVVERPQVQTNFQHDMIERFPFRARSSGSGLPLVSSRA
jgi:hypothetical protein